MNIEPIAHIHTDFPEKFGIPRQSGLVQESLGIIQFESAFKDPDCIRGLEGFDYIWLIWGFDHGQKNTWAPTVRPPLLGGNKRMGVFATRSPFRPNPLGLSSVRLDHIEYTKEGPLLYVYGADLRDGTEIFDLKPYLPYVDVHDSAKGGFTDTNDWQTLKVVFPAELQGNFDTEAVCCITKLLSLDPRPATHRDNEREYAMAFRAFDIHFTVDDDAKVITVTAVSNR